MVGRRWVNGAGCAGLGWLAGTLGKVLLGWALLALPWVSATAATNVTTAYAWSETSGWVNHAPSGGGVFVYDDHLEGFAWAENIGWIKLGSHTGGGSHTYGNTGATDWGVNRNAGNLSGYAWSETAGWINFKPTAGGVTVDAASGQLDGYAWGENIGWLHLRNGAPAYGVRFDPFAGLTVTAAGGTPQSAPVLGTFPAPLMVLVKNATGNPLAGVSVSFTAPATGASGTFSNSSATVTVNSDATGLASSGAVRANGTAGGPYVVSASAGAASVGFNLTNSAAAASVALSATPVPLPLGQTATLTATLTGANPTGTVQFMDGAATLGAPVAIAGGKASLSVNTLSAGVHSLTAVYSGDANNAGATSSALLENVYIPGSGDPQVTGSTIGYLARPASCRNATVGILDLAQGDGPTLLNRMISQLSVLLGHTLTFKTQTACGTVLLGGFGDAGVAFVPTGLQSGDARGDGLYLVGDGQYQLVVGGNALTIVPGLANLGELAAQLPPGSTLEMTATGVLFAMINGVGYAVQPDVLVQFPRPVGPAMLAVGGDGHLRFIDSGGNSQILYPAFLEPTTLLAVLQRLDPAARLVIQLDGSARAIFPGQSYQLAPDLALGANAAASASPWQNGNLHFEFANSRHPGTSQGFGVAP